MQCRSLLTWLQCQSKNIYQKTLKFKNKKLTFKSKLRIFYWFHKKKINTHTCSQSTITWDQWKARHMCLNIIWYSKLTGIMTRQEICYNILTETVHRGEDQSHTPTRLHTLLTNIPDFSPFLQLPDTSCCLFHTCNLYETTAARQGEIV
jgi:hypothetical protein